MPATRLLLTTCLATAVAASACSAEKTYVNKGAAMEPTIHCARPKPGCEGDRDDRVKVEEAQPDELKRGDVVLFETPPNASEVCGVAGRFIKRIVGLPGEMVEIRLEGGEGYVYVDGQRLDESSYLEDSRRGSGSLAGAGRYDVPDGQFFLLGDNRPVSCDSRFFGPVPEDGIVGRVTDVVH